MIKAPTFLFVGLGLQSILSSLHIDIAAIAHLGHGPNNLISNMCVLYFTLFFFQLLCCIIFERFTCLSNSLWLVKDTRPLMLYVSRNLIFHPTIFYHVCLTFFINTTKLKASSKSISYQLKNAYYTITIYGLRVCNTSPFI